MKVAISKRNEMRTNYQSALNELDAKEAQHRKYASQPGKEEKAEKLAQEVEKAKKRLAQQELVGRRDQQIVGVPRHAAVPVLRAPRVSQRRPARKVRVPASRLESRARLSPPTSHRRHVRCDVFGARA